MITKNNKKVKNLNIKFDDPSIVPSLLGINNKNLKIIETMIEIDLDSKGDTISVSGNNEKCLLVKKVLEDIYNDLKNQKKNKIEFNELTLNALIRDSLKNNTNKTHYKKFFIDPIKTWKKYISAKTEGHSRYLTSLKDNDVVICSGPAGTGKTYMAVASAVSALKLGEVERIILSRPAVEAGEKLGFLPGDMKEKVDPYLRPIYDALYDMIPSDRVEKKIVSGEIEIAPLAFMRGRTLSGSYVIIDEAQNTTSIQMKMLLTRLGEGSKMVITGDLSQIDLPPNQKSGLIDAINKLDNIAGLSIIELNSVDIVRHPLVAQIVQAYENNSKK